MKSGVNTDFIPLIGEIVSVVQDNISNVKNIVSITSDGYKTDAEKAVIACEKGNLAIRRQNEIIRNRKKESAAYTGKDLEIVEGGKVEEEKVSD